MLVQAFLHSLHCAARLHFTNLQRAKSYRLRLCLPMQGPYCLRDIKAWLVQGHLTRDVRMYRSGQQTQSRPLQDLLTPWPSHGSSQHGPQVGLALPRVVASFYTPYECRVP